MSKEITTNEGEGILTNGIARVKNAATTMLEGDGVMAQTGRIQKDAILLAAQVEFGKLGLDGINTALRGVMPEFLQPMYDKYAQNPLGQVVLAAALTSVAVILKNQGIGTDKKIPGLNISIADFYCQLAACMVKAATVHGAREAEIEKLLAKAFPIDKFKDMISAFRKIEDNS